MSGYGARKPAVNKSLNTKVRLSIPSEYLCPVAKQLHESWGNGNSADEGSKLFPRSAVE